MSPKIALLREEVVMRAPQALEPARSTPAPVLAAASVAVSLGIMPFVYGLLAHGSDLPKYFHGAEFWHIMANGAANCLVMLSALRLNGRLDRKLADVLTRVLIVHGLLAFIILTTRQFYSNQVMLTAGAGSVLLGPLVMYARHRTIRPRAALLGPWHPLAEGLQIPVDHIEDPTSHIREYEVLLTTSVTELSPAWSPLLSKAMLAGQSVRHLAEYVEEDRGIVSIEHFDLEHLPQGGLVSYRARKRLLDIVLVLSALPIALPVLGIGIVVTAFSGPGPVFFVQERTGLGGKAFRMYKLRTMRPVPTEGPLATVVGDQRVTPAGVWLRRFRIDELPQLWNVLKGDMSVVGPRPEWTLLSEQYVRNLPVYAYRHLVRPGITGWAQVKGGYAADLAETRVKVGYDLFYIKNLSFSLDIQILVRTVWTLISGSGAR